MSPSPSGPAPAMSIGAAISEHPIAAHATGEVVGSLLEQVGPEPDLAVLFSTGAHIGALEDVVHAVRRILAPRALVGASAVSVLAGAREVEEQPALAVWAARCGSVSVVRLDAMNESFAGFDVGAVPPAATMVLLADPATFPVERFLNDANEACPTLQVVGGVASAGFGRGANRLVVDGELRDGGAVGVLLGDELPVTTVVSQGCRPIGDPFTVTRSERNVIYEIGGRPALDRLQSVLAGLDEHELAMARQGLHIGRVIDESRVEFERGDFLVRNVLGADREAGAIAVGDEIGVGDTVQFQVRDADSADEDLRLLLDGHTADGALVFTCNGRGRRLFGRPDHDAEVVVDSIDSTSIAGMFCAGEMGPVGRRSFLHGFTASVALFGSKPGPTRQVGWPG